MCKHDSIDKRPQIFKDNNLFILPIKNGQYIIIKGNGYIEIPEIESKIITYNSKLNFELESSKIGNSEMQHIDYAYASSLIRTFLNDDSLVLTIRGRKYSGNFEFEVQKQKVSVNGVQIEVDAGYEGRNKIVLIEAKNSETNNTIIRQLFYPYKHWKSITKKNIHTIFFEKRGEIYNLWEFTFKDANDYNSIKIVKSARYKIL